MASQALLSLGAVLREATNARFVRTGRLLWRRYVFVAGRIECPRAMTAGAYERAERLQRDRPVLAAEQGRRSYWWFHDRFWWESDGLAAGDVLALVIEREQRARRRLERAHALLRAPAPGGRAAIPLDVKRAVWERCGGRCVECGTDSVLEFDHVIPLAMGGSNREANLQLLCAQCNRAKGDAL
jgi:hypothetical protein